MRKENMLNTNEYCYAIDFSMFSLFSDDNPNEFISTYMGKIIEIDLHTDKQTIIGKVCLKILLIVEAINNEVNVYDIFDTEEYTYRIGSRIYDFEEQDYKSDIQNFYREEIFPLDLCIIQRLEIIEEYRGKGIGEIVLENIKKRFASSCGLFVTQTYPIQFELASSDFLLNEKNKMKLDSLDKDYEKSFYKLKSFYQKSGFHHIEGFDDLMFSNPSINE